MARPVGTGSGNRSARRDVPAPIRIVLPVQIVELQGGDFTAAQAQVQQAARHGVAARTVGVTLIKGPQKAGRFIRRERGRQRRQAPARDRGESGDQGVDAIGAPCGSETQVAAEGAGADACGAWRVVRPVSLQEVQDVARGEALDGERPATEAIRQELLDPPPTAGASLGRQPADLLQIPGEALQFVVNRERPPDAACRDSTVCS